MRPSGHAPKIQRGLRIYEVLAWIPATLTFLLAVAVSFAVVTGLHLSNILPCDGESVVNAETSPSAPVTQDAKTTVFHRLLPKKLRPRKPVLIGVMTTAKFIDTRALAAYRTWGETISDLVFFSSEGTRSKYGLPVVALRDIDDSYPPQRKAFAMLRYMNEHFGNDYDFFLRLDDDVYVRKQRLLRLIAFLGSQVNIYLGQPGQGRDSEDLGLTAGRFDRYCMGGPGVLFSRSVLRGVAPHVDFCIRNTLMTNHEDVEIGRCIWQFTRVSCTQNAEMQSLFFHGFSPSMIFSDKLQAAELRYAVTVHSLKNQTHVYKLHNHFLEMDKRLAKRDLLQQNKSLMELQKYLRAFDSGQVTHYNMAAMSAGKNRPVDLKTLWSSRQLEAFPLSVISDAYDPWNLYVWNSPQPRVYLDYSYRRSVKVALGKFMRIAQKNLAKGMSINYLRLNIGWRLFDLFRGHKLTCDSRILRRYPSGKTTDREERFQFWHKLEGPVLEPDFPADLSAQVNIVIPIAGNIAMLGDFLKTFEEEVLLADKKVSLLVVVFAKSATGSPIFQSKDLIELYINELKAKYPQQKMWIAHADKTESLSVITAINMAAKHLRSGLHDKQKEYLIFLASVDVTIRTPFLQRCRLHARARTSVFFPIPFGLYNEDVRKSAEMRVSSRNGQWMPEAYPAACFHDTDMQVLPVDEIRAESWRWPFEEVAVLMTKMITVGFDVVRAVDPDLLQANRNPSVCDDLRENKTVRAQCRRIWLNLVGRSDQIYSHLFGGKRTNLPGKWQQSHKTILKEADTIN